MTENEWFEQREIELTNDIISMATIIDDYLISVSFSKSSKLKQ